MEPADTDDQGLGASSVGAVLELIGQGICDLQSAPTLTLSDAEVRAAVARAHQVAGQLEAAVLHLVRTLDDRPEAVPGCPAGKTAATFLVHAVRVDPGRAARDVAAARRLDPSGAGTGRDDRLGAPAERGLPRLGRALASGQISRQHVDIAVGCLDRLPTDTLADTDADGVAGIERVDEFLAEQAARHSPAVFRRIARQLEAALAPEREFDPEAHTRRFLHLGTDGSGMVVGRFALSPADGVLFRNVIHALSAPRSAAGPGVQPSADGEPAGDVRAELPIGDLRTAAQRRADALAQLARLAVGRDATGDPDPAPPGRTPVHVSLVATLEQVMAALGVRPAAGVGLANDLGPGGGPVPPAVLAQSLCTAVISPTILDGNGAVLAQGRAVRLATIAQRRAVFARDRGCVVPGCTAPPQWCEVHHVVPWSEGGATDVDNLAAICARHHSELHAGGWGMVVIDDLPHVVPPFWLDPTRTPRRNTGPRDEAAALRLAARMSRQLELDLGGWDGDRRDGQGERGGAGDDP